MRDWRDDRIDSAINGTNPMVMAELTGSFVAFGDTQFLPGYCVILPKRKVPSLNDLEINERTSFLCDMSLVGDILLKVCSCQRVNYDILGNTDNFLHAHVFPRYLTENSKRLAKPVWLYDSSFWTDSKYQYDANKHGKIRQAITEELKKITQGEIID